jgi:hypothetical protein
MSSSDKSEDDDEKVEICEEKNENDDWCKQRKMSYVNKKTMITRFFAMNE